MWRRRVRAKRSSWGVAGRLCAVKMPRWALVRRYAAWARATLYGGVNCDDRDATGFGGDCGAAP
ncbi:MAG: hypothetical protein V3T08_03660, partial [Gemmatimonadota bacterium]